MKTSKLEPKKDYIAGALVAGIPQEDIARELRVNQSTISRFSSKEEIKTVIEAETKNLLEALPDAVENVKTLVRGMKDLPISESKARELALKASFRVLETGGVLNSSSPSQVVLNISRNDNYVSPIVDKIIGSLALEMPDGEED